MAAPSGMGPSTRQILTASAIALAVSGVVLLTAILPAEYGVDPTGMGRVLGLQQMTEPKPAEILPASPGKQYVPRKAGAASLYGAAYKTESVEFVLRPYQYMEYKYRLENGGSMVFSWASSVPVEYDFHGDPDDNLGKGAVSYDENAAQSGNGSIVAPFKGIHGWYWENTTGAPVTIRLNASGFFDSGLELRSDKTTKVHDLKPIGGN